MMLQGFYDGLKPIPITLVSDWADNNRYLTSESSAEPGRWSTNRTPYLREILDNLSPNTSVNEIIVIKGVQLGFTEAGLNVVGCYADISPCPIMYVMPTIEVAKGFSESRVDPMIGNCPSLSEKIKPARERDSGNTKFTKKFSGGILVISGANSAASLRSRPIRVLVLDEVDAYPINVDDEGSPISLASKRQATFGLKKKRYMLSTPTTEAESVIEPEYLKTDQRKFYVPCPHCGSFQELLFTQLKWEKGKPETVMYECGDCKEYIPERFKTRMLENGEWRATAPQNGSPLKKGYHINSLYSPIGWMSWLDIATEYEDALTSEPKMITFTNTILGETWKVKGEVPEWNNLYNRREKYELNKPNKEVAFITVGVDVQKDRLECHIVGWCKNKISYSIDYRVLLGETSSVQVWNKLAEIVNETWEREDGIILPMKLMAVDTGYNTSFVYDFCRRFDITKVIPIKGQDKQGIMVAPPRQVDTTSSGKKIGKIKVWNIGVSLIKSEIYGYLKLNIDEHGNVPHGFMHFPQYDAHFFRGITAEQLEFKIQKGFKKYEWVKKYHENEPLDTTVYARAAAAVVGIDRMKDEHFNLMNSGNKKTIIRKEIEPTIDKDEVNSKPVKKKKRSSFWN